MSKHDSDRRNVTNKSDDCADRDKSAKFKRIKLIKKLLKYVPRKTNLHKYPVLKNFATVARRRSYLWSFRVSEAIPSFYLGWIIMLTPLPAIVHLIIAFFAALTCQANLTILLLLPLLSNTITFVFWWAITYKVGRLVMILFGINDLSCQCIAFNGIKSLIHYGKAAIHGLLIITLGAIVLGAMLGAISSAVYKCFATDCRTTKYYQ